MIALHTQNIQALPVHSTPHLRCQGRQQPPMHTPCIQPTTCAAKLVCFAGGSRRAGGPHPPPHLGQTAVQAKNRCWLPPPLLWHQHQTLELPLLRCCCCRCHCCPSSLHAFVPPTLHTAACPPAALRCRLAQARLAQGRWEAAVTACRQGEALSPKDSEGRSDFSPLLDRIAVQAAKAGSLAGYDGLQLEVGEGSVEWKGGLGGSGA